MSDLIHNSEGAVVVGRLRKGDTEAWPENVSYEALVQCDSG